MELNEIGRRAHGTRRNKENEKAALRKAERAAADLPKDDKQN
jgi:hypothetical protein